MLKVTGTIRRVKLINIFVSLTMRTLSEEKTYFHITKSAISLAPLGS